jgi:hypothetical protein
MAVTDAANRLAQEGDADNIELQGTVDVVYVCPGFGDEPATNVEQGGAIHLTLSVKDSFVQRGMGGAAAGCRFTVSQGQMNAHVRLDAALAIDLGATSHIGARIEPDLMVRLRNVQADVTSDSAGLQLLQDLYDFRVNHERVETLIDMWTIGFSELGTAVLIASKDGSLSLREARGEWLCGSAEDSCELQR